MVFSDDKQTHYSVKDTALVLIRSWGEAFERDREFQNFFKTYQALLGTKTDLSERARCNVSQDKGCRSHRRRPTRLLMCPPLTMHTFLRCVVVVVVARRTRVRVSRPKGLKEVIRNAVKRSERHDVGMQCPAQMLTTT